MQTSNSTDCFSQSQFNDSSNGECAELAIDISDYIAEFRSQPPIQAGDLTIEYLVCPPDETEIAPSDNHTLVLSLSYDTRQVNQLDGGEYDGAVDHGDFYLLPSGNACFCACETAGEGLVFIINPNFLPHIVATTECLNPDKIELRSVLLNRDPQLTFIANSCLSEMTTDGLGGKLYTESLANLFAIHLLRNYCTTPAKLRTYEGGLSKLQLKRSLDYIHANLDNELSLETIASELNLSHYYFCSLFKQSIGVSPWQYVIKQRVERAKQLLKNSELAISEVALACGFAHQSHLNKHFRKLTGIAPNRYRRG